MLLHEEATAFIRKDPATAAKMIAGYVGVVDADFVLDTLMVSPKYCAQLTEDYISSTMRFVPVLQKLGYIQSDIVQDRIFSREIISRIHPEKDHYRDSIRIEGFAPKTADRLS